MQTKHMRIFHHKEDIENNNKERRWNQRCMLSTHMEMKRSKRCFWTSKCNTETISRKLQFSCLDDSNNNEMFANSYKKSVFSLGIYYS